MIYFCQKFDGVKRVESVKSRYSAGPNGPDCQVTFGKSNIDFEMSMK